MTPIIEARNITKRFPGVLANDDVSFSLNKGEILAFLGENGAGKSTLMNILYGLYSADEGEVYVNGDRVDIQEPRDAIDLGIGMVHQHFQLVPVFTVAENIVMGTEPTQFPFSWLAYGISSGVVALLAFLGAIFGQSMNAIYAALYGAGIVAAFYLLFYAFGWFSRQKAIIYIPIVSAIGIAAGMVTQGVPGKIPLNVTLSVLFANASYLALRVLSTALNRQAATRRILELSEQYGLVVDPQALVEDIPVGVQQRVEILKTLYREADVLILDEPTAVLTPQETEELFEIMQSLVDQGKSIIFITHKLKEIMSFADRVVVLRNGRLVGETTPEESSRENLAEMMVGREVSLVVDKETASPGDAVLEVEGLFAEDDRHQTVLRDVSLSVHKGEVLGVAGVQGNGQTELVEVLTGLRTATGGRFNMLGQNMTNASPRRITELGVAHIPEDRQHDGLVLPSPVFDNVILNTYYKKPFADKARLQFENIHVFANRLVDEFDVRPPNSELLVESLSGGNQQKVIVAREFSRPIDLLIAAQPTRGLDVGSIEYIHRRLIEKRDEGCAVLLVSVELDEIMALSDRIAVMYEGEITAIVAADEVTRNELGLLMAGSSLEKEKEA